MKKKIILASVILVVIAGAILGFVLINNNKKNSIKYRTEAVSRGDIEAVVVTSGTLNPVTVVDVGSQVSGRIAKLNADFNSQVKEGQVVAELDQSILQSRVQQNEANYQSSVAALERAKVTLDNLKKKYDRSLELFGKNLISYEEKEAAETQYLSAKTDVQSAQARLEQAKSQLDSSKVDLSYAIIKSPIDGIVISRNVNLGQTVAASFQAPVLFQIANDLSKMRLECSVDEGDIGKVKEGQKVRFTVESFPKDTFSGTVTQVRYSPEVVQNVVTYTTIVEVENPEMKLMPGMTATVTIIIGEAKNVLRVSNAALRFTPPLAPEQMQEIMKSAGQAMMEGRQRAAQTGGATPSGIPQRIEGERQIAGFNSPDARAGNQGGARRQQASRVWIEDKNGKLFPIFIRPGLADDSYTEIAWGDLKEGQLVITGMESGKETSAMPGRPPGGMFIRR